MKKTLLAMSALAGMVGALAGQAQATTADIHFSGGGVSGALVLTYGTATDGKYSNAFEVTNISGTFSDSNIGIADASVGSLVAINHAAPESTNLLAPDDFSKFGPLTGLPVNSNGFITYDNLFWPGGSPGTATDFDVGGGFLDIYGVMFNIGGGKVVDFWANGVFAPGAPADYGVAVGNSDKALDYVSGGVSASAPEPSTWAMMALGFLGLGLAGIRARPKAVSATA